jgi:arylsulfatase
VGLPGSPLGLRKEDPTLAELLKPFHGFDEFFGNLYHLNAEEEPEEPLYPKDPAFRKEFGPRGVLDCKAAATPQQSVPRQQP